MGILLGKWKLYLIGALLAALVTAAWQWRAEIETRVRYAVQGEQLQHALKAAEQRAEQERAERERIERLSSDRHEQVETLRLEYRERQKALRELQEHDDDLHTWASGRLPGAVIERLRPAARRDTDHHGNRD